MTDFPILPRQGAGPVRFGMSEDEVTELLGAPSGRSNVEDYVDVYYDNFINVSFRNGRAFQVGATRRATGVTFEGTDIFEADPMQVLQQVERAAGEAFLCYGFVIFPRLEMSLTGFHDDDLDTKAMTVSEDGSWEDLRPSFEPVSFLA